MTINKLELLYDIEGSLAVLELRIPYGLRKSSQVSRAVYCVGQLIEEEIKSQTKQGNKHIIPSYADGKYQEIEFEYNTMQQALDDVSDSKLVTKHTRAKRDGTLLLCPKCKDTFCVYHFSWTALVCLNCGTSVNKYDWRIADE